MDRVRAFLQFAGKGERKVLAVFGVSPTQCDRAVRYLRKSVPDVPVWLFAAREPLPETAAECERVYVDPDAMQLLVTAEKELWPRWVALALVTWTREHGKWPLKLAPFLVPPGRVLIMNEHQGFFDGSPRHILRHAALRLRDLATSGWHRLLDWKRGLALLVFSWIAQRFSPISRRVFRKRHGTAPLSLPAESPRGTCVSVFRYGHRQWNRRQLDSSDGDYLLLLDGLADAPIDDLLPLFDDPRTFAVSRQASYRLWRPILIPAAPFRQLPPGAATQVLAPVARAILLDRRKLQALGGMPETVVPGSALYLIFWKAAAAGWRSYSVGGSAKLEEAADWPYEEAEFVRRVLSDPELRQLGPREPDLARGNIIFQPGARGRLGGRPCVLVVSPYLPWPLSHGGAVRIWNLCRALADRVDFILATFREQDDIIDFAQLHEVFREVYVVDLDEKAVKDETLPMQVRAHQSRSMRALIAELCRARPIDLLQVEFTHLAAFRDAAPEVPAILVEHDLTFTLYRQFAERAGTRAARAEYERWLAFERRWLRAYDAVWTMSDDDRAQAVAEGSGLTFAVPNGVDLERFVPNEEPAEAPELFYVGSFRHQPNIFGFEKLRREVMPRVWARRPEVRLRVVAGPDPQRHWREYPASLDPRIEMHAFVADLRPLYARATLVVVPLLVSAGTNIKVMEAMACRKAVVTTPIGCIGLGLRDGHDALIREDSAAFAAAICELLDDPDRRARIAAEARRTVERRFSWAAIADQAYASYEKLLGVPAP